MKASDDNRVPSISFKALFWGSTLLFVMLCIYAFIYTEFATLIYMESWHEKKISLLITLLIEITLDKTDQLISFKWRRTESIDASAFAT